MFLASLSVLLVTFGLGTGHHAMLLDGQTSWGLCKEDKVPIGFFILLGQMRTKTNTNRLNQEIFED